MISYYTRRDDAYYLYTSNAMRTTGEASAQYIGTEIAIGFTVHPLYGKALLHKHGSKDAVGRWFERAIAKIMLAGVPKLTEDVKMLVLSEIDPEKINRMVHRSEYLGEWLKENDIKL